MKSGVKIAAAAITLSVFTIGAASAMIPQVDLKVNPFVDQGVSSQVLSDIDSNAFKIQADTVGPGASNKSENPQPLSQHYHQLVGKHII